MSHLEPNIEKEVLANIEEVWKEFPYMRFTQLLLNANNSKEACSEVFYTEDRQLMVFLGRFKERFLYNGKSKK